MEETTGVRKTSRYVVFTCMKTDVLVRIETTDGRQECPSADEATKMCEAAEVRVKNNGACVKDAVVAALTCAGYDSYEIVYVGEMCHIHL